jgi:dihydroxy-acid dehydratase
MFTQHIQQADKGCDFDFLRSPEPVPEPEVH